MIQNLNERRGHLNRFRITYTDITGRYHRQKVWADSEESAKAILNKRAGTDTPSLTWEEGLIEYGQAKLGVEISEGYFASVESTFIRLPFKPKQIEDTQAKELADHLTSVARGTSPQSANRQRAEIMAVLNHLHRLGRIDATAFRRIPKLRSTPAVRRHLPTSQLHQYLSAIEDYPTRLIVHFLSITGLRVSEAAGLLEENINDHTFTVHCKGGKIRHLPTAVVEPILAEARNYKQERGIYSQFVFVNSRGNPFNPRSLYRTTQTFWEKAGLDTRITLHSLRHGWATALAEQGASIEQIGAGLGHSLSSKKMTANYIHLPEDTGFKQISREIENQLQHQRSIAARQNLSVINRGA